MAFQYAVWSQALFPIFSITTREQTLERCPKLTLASAFFAPRTKGPLPAGTKDPCPAADRWAGTKAFSPGLGDAPGIKINLYSRFGPLTGTNNPGL